MNRSRMRRIYLRNSRSQCKALRGQVCTSHFWAILGNALRHGQEDWQCWQRGIYKLHPSHEANGFESHPHRHLFYNLEAFHGLAERFYIASVQMEIQMAGLKNMARRPSNHRSGNPLSAGQTRPLVHQ